MGWINRLEKYWRIYNKSILDRIVLNEVSSFHNSPDLVGIALGLNADNGTHCGILLKYKDNGKIISEFLHLAWHTLLKLDNPYYPNVYLREFKYVKLDIHLERLPIFVNYCRLIYEENKDKIYYAPKLGNTIFKENGVLKLDKGNKSFGLTCATFVIAVFNGGKIKILNHKIWPKRIDDKIWHEHVVSQLIHHQQAFNITQEHIENVRVRNKNCARFKPEEVVASLTSQKKPCIFWYAWFVGAFIRERLN